MQCGTNISRFFVFAKSDLCAEFFKETIHLSSFLGSENFLHKIADVFGFKDIDFKNYPLFSKNYLLKGTNEQAIRKLFDSQIINFFEQKRIHSVIESGMNKIVYYKLGKRVKPDQLNSFIEEVRRIVELFDR